MNDEKIAERLRDNADRADEMDRRCEGGGKCSQHEVYELIQMVRRTGRTAAHTLTDKDQQLAAKDAEIEALREASERLLASGMTDGKGGVTVSFEAYAEIRTALREDTR